MNKKELKKFNQTLDEINEKCKIVINTIKKYDENVLSFGKYSVYKNDSFTIDEKNEIIKIEYFEWGFKFLDFDYIEIPFDEFNKNLENFCKKYVDDIHKKEIENIKKLKENANLLKQ